MNFVRFSKLVGGVFIVLVTVTFFISSSSYISTHSDRPSWRNASDIPRIKMSGTLRLDYHLRGRDRQVLSVKVPVPRILRLCRRSALPRSSC